LSEPTRKAGRSRARPSIRFLPRGLLRSPRLARAHGLLIACGRSVALLEAGAAARVPPPPERWSEVVAATIPADQLLAIRLRPRWPTCGLRVLRGRCTLRLGCRGLFPGADGIRTLGRLLEPSVCHLKASGSYKKWKCRVGRYDVVAGRVRARLAGPHSHITPLAT
jgi:hypothetical protein